MSSFAAKMKLKAAAAAEKAKATAAAAAAAAKEVDAKHNVTRHASASAKSAANSVSSAASTAQKKMDGVMTEEQQQNAMMGATLGLSAMSMVGVPGAGAALTGIAVAGTATSLHAQQKAQGGSLTKEQMLGGAVGLGSAVSGAKTKLAMGAVGVGMQSQQQQRQQQSGGGGSGGLLQQKMAQAKQAKKVMDVGKSLGITPQQALQGAKMAKKAGVL